MEVDDSIQAVAAATFTAGVSETCKCDQGSREHDWEWSDGISDIEGQTARVAASELGNERVSNRESRRGDGGDWEQRPQARGAFGGSPNALLTQSKCLYRKRLMMDRYRFKDAK